MGTQIHELEEQVEEWNHTIEVLENQLQTSQQHLQEVNKHLDMHHQEIHQDMEVDEDMDIDDEDSERLLAWTASIARLEGPPSLESSVASFAH